MTVNKVMFPGNVLVPIVTSIVFIVVYGFFSGVSSASEGLPGSSQSVQSQVVEKEFPHGTDGESCLLCHAVRPAGKAPQQALPDSTMQTACDRCHISLADSHYQGSDPFLDTEIRKEAMDSGILPKNGQLACTSCHDPHGKTDGKGILRAEYLGFCNKSRSIDPHWNNRHCLSCHERQPVKGNVSLQKGGDGIALCNRCHASVYARADIHPVGVEPSSTVRIPAHMVLENGKLTCLTCHDPFCQIGTVKKGKRFKTNVVFLRGKQRSRSGFCFLCHVGENYNRLNPHEQQVDEQGRIQEETCLFCHSSVPDQQVPGVGTVQFVVKNPNATCIGCHHGFTKAHPAGTDHLKVPSRTIMRVLKSSEQRIGVALPLFKGKIVCTTCHNPHQAGVIRFAAAATGAKRGHKLRLMPGIMQCIGCHWDKR